MLFYAGDAKLLGYYKIFAQFLEDMKDLETVGIDVHTDTYTGNVKVGIASCRGQFGHKLSIWVCRGFHSQFSLQTLWPKSHKIPVTWQGVSEESNDYVLHSAACRSSMS